MIIQTLITYISNFSPAVPIVIGKGKKGIIWLYACTCIIFDLVGLILKRLDVERFWVSNLFFVLEFILISAFFIKNVFPNRYKKIFWLCVVVFSFYFIVHTYMLSVFKPNYIDASKFYGFYILFSFAGLYKVINEIEYVQIEKSPLFIFCIAFLIYASGSFMILLFQHELLKEYKSLITSIWLLIRNPLNIIKNLLLGYGLWLLKKNK